MRTLATVLLLGLALVVSTGCKVPEDPEQLARIEWRGTTFNNNSPLYLRELPVSSRRPSSSRSRSRS